MEPTIVRRLGLILQPHGASRLFPATKFRVQGPRLRVSDTPSRRRASLRLTLSQFCFGAYCGQVELANYSVARLLLKKMS